MSDFQLSVLCLVVTLALYFANKRLYRRFHRLPLMPLVFTPPRRPPLSTAGTPVR